MNKYVGYARDVAVVAAAILGVIVVLNVLTGHPRVAVQTGCCEASPTPSPSPTIAPLPPVPNLAGFEQHMKDKGKVHCEAQRKAVADWAAGTTSIDPPLAATFYDQENVFQNIAEYTGDSDGYWKGCADLAEQVYRGKRWPNYPSTSGLPGSKYPYGYLFGNGGGIPGYWIMPEGVYQDGKAGDVDSKDALFQLSERAAYAPDLTAIVNTASATLSRETAYNVRTMLRAEMLGHAHRTRMDQMIEQILAPVPATPPPSPPPTTTVVTAKGGHFRQWLDGTYIAPPNFQVTGCINQFYIQPFMTGLSMRAVIAIFEWQKANGTTPDPRIYSTVKEMQEWLRKYAWDPAKKAWWYENCAPPTTVPSDVFNTLPVKAGAPDLNMLILPALGWLYSQDGDRQWIEWGDEAFDGGVKGAYLDGAKQFNQNYYWSFDYLKWRASRQPAGSR